MAESARVTSIEALEAFRPALVAFAEETSAALMSAESDAGRTAQWLRGEMIPYWKKEVRVRNEDLVRAKSKLTVKQHEKEGEARTSVDERKAVEKARRRLEAAQDKLVRAQQWARKLEKAQDDFRGAIGSFKVLLDQQMPRSVARLDYSIAKLDAYVKLAPKPSATGPAPNPGTDPAMGGEP